MYIDININNICRYFILRSINFITESIINYIYCISMVFSLYNPCFLQCYSTLKRLHNQYVLLSFCAYDTQDIYNCDSIYVMAITFVFDC